MTIIREIQEPDAERFLSLCKQLDEESKFMLLEPGERKTTLEQQRQRIRNVLSTDNQAIFVAEENARRLSFRKWRPICHEQAYRLYCDWNS